MDTVKHNYPTKNDKIMTKMGFGYSQISSCVMLSVICPCSDVQRDHLLPPDSFNSDYHSPTGQLR